MRKLGKMTGLKSPNLQEQKCGARKGSSSDGSGQLVAVFPFFFSFLESVFINDQLKLAEGSLVCNLSF